MKARNVSGRGEEGQLCDSGSKILLGREGEMITAMVIDTVVLRNATNATNGRVEVLLFLPRSWMGSGHLVAILVYFVYVSRVIFRSPSGDESYQQKSDASLPYF